MLCHPFFISTKIGGDAECKAFLAEQNISTITGVNRHNEIVLREMNDVALIGIQLCFGMEALNEAGVIAQSVENFCADAGHNGHGEDNIN